MKILSDTAKKLYALPPVKWREAIEKLQTQQAYELQTEFDQVAIWAATLSGYLEATKAGGGQTHDDAVKYSLRRRKQVRKALGFSLPDDGLRF